MSGWSIIGRAVRGRKCGVCTVCCIQLPVADIDKPANTRCGALCSRGCRIYARRPISCRMFSCRWLMDETTAELRRPDKTGYVIDPTLDTILIDKQPAEVVQVWVDPARPDAHRDPALRRWLAGVGERHGLPALIRWDSTRAMFLAPPCMSSTGDWIEKTSAAGVTREEIARMTATGAA